MYGHTFVSPECSAAEAVKVLQPVETTRNNFLTLVNWSRSNSMNTEPFRLFFLPLRNSPAVGQGLLIIEDS